MCDQEGNKSWYEEAVKMQQNIPNPGEKQRQYH